MRNPCKECVYYHPENNTCQSKKCETGGYGYVGLWERLFCEPAKRDDTGEGESDAEEVY